MSHRWDLPSAEPMATTPSHVTSNIDMARARQTSPPNPSESHTTSYRAYNPNGSGIDLLAIDRTFRHLMETMRAENEELKRLTGSLKQWDIAKDSLGLQIWKDLFASGLQFPPGTSVRFTTDSVVFERCNFQSKESSEQQNLGSPIIFSETGRGHETGHT